MRDNGKGMGFGIFLLTVGIVWLLYIAKIVTLSTFYALFTLWPLILVAIGVGIIFRNSRLIRSASWLVILAVVIGYGYFSAPVKGPVIINNTKAADTIVAETKAADTESEVSDAADVQDEDTKVTIEKLPETEKGNLTIKLGATQLFLDSETSNLLDASITKELVKHSESMKDSNRMASILFEMKGYNAENLKFVNKLRNDFHLNKDVIWKLELDTGAIDGNLDMTGLKIEKLDIDTGASKFKLDMGSYNTELDIDAGASVIEIIMPEDTGMRINLDGGLNSTNLDGPGWVKKGDWYYSPGYDSKSFKIEANVNLGVGKLTVNNK